MRRVSFPLRTTGTLWRTSGFRTARLFSETRTGDHASEPSITGADDKSANENADTIVEQARARKGHQVPKEQAETATIGQQAEAVKKQAEIAEEQIEATQQQTKEQIEATKQQAEAAKKQAETIAKQQDKEQIEATKQQAEVQAETTKEQLKPKSGLTQRQSKPRLPRTTQRLSGKRPKQAEATSSQWNPSLLAALGTLLAALGTLVGIGFGWHQTLLGIKAASDQDNKSEQSKMLERLHLRWVNDEQLILARRLLDPNLYGSLIPLPKPEVRPAPSTAEKNVSALQGMLIFSDVGYGLSSVDLPPTPEPTFETKLLHHWKEEVKEGTPDPFPNAHPKDFVLSYSANFVNALSVVRLPGGAWTRDELIYRQAFIHLLEFLSDVEISLSRGAIKLDDVALWLFPTISLLSRPLRIWFPAPPRPALKKYLKAKNYTGVSHRKPEAIEEAKELSRILWPKDPANAVEFESVPSCELIYLADLWEPFITSHFWLVKKLRERFSSEANDQKYQLKMHQRDSTWGPAIPKPGKQGPTTEFYRIYRQYEKEIVSGKAVDEAKEQVAKAEEEKKESEKKLEDARKKVEKAKEEEKRQAEEEKAQAEKKLEDATKKLEEAKEQEKAAQVTFWWLPQWQAEALMVERGWLTQEVAPPSCPEKPAQGS